MSDFHAGLNRALTDVAVSLEGFRGDVASAKASAEASAAAVASLKDLVESAVAKLEGGADAIVRERLREVGFELRNGQAVPLHGNLPTASPPPIWHNPKLVGPLGALIGGLGTLAASFASGLGG